MMDRTKSPSEINESLEGKNRPAGSPHVGDPAALSAALTYLRLGWSVIPLCPADHSGQLPPKHCEHCSRPGKQPPYRWKRFQAERADEVTIRGWWKVNPAFNVGVVLGSASDLVAWDVDGDSGEIEINRIFKGAIPETLEFTSGRGGRRLFFRPCPERTCPGPKLGFNGKKLDFLGQGSQTVMPPSLHASGNLYAWSKGWNKGSPVIATATPEMIDLILNARGKRSLPSGGARGGELRVTDRAKNVIRARADILTWDPCVSGQGGQGRLFNKCCRLVKGYGLPVAVALALFKEGYNDRCDPPWSDGELLHALTNAELKGNYDPIEERPRPNSTLIPANSAGNGPAGNSPPPPPTRPATPPAGDTLPGVLASSLTAREVEWYYPPYIPRGMLTAVVGRPNVGKSTFLCHIAGSSRSCFFLPGEEDVSRMLVPRLDAHGVDRGKVRILAPDPRLTFPRAADDVARWMLRAGVDLLVIDPIDEYLSPGIDDNNNLHVRDVLGSLKHVAEQTRAAVVLCRHPGKDPNNVMVGSRAWAAFFRSVVELVYDQGPPERRIISSYRNALGYDPPARQFELVGFTGKPRVFTMGEVADAGAVEMAKEVQDRIERSNVDQAEDLIRALLSDGEVESSEIFKAAERERLKSRTVYVAADRIGVIRRRPMEGTSRTSYWRLPPAGGGEVGKS